VRVRRRVEFDFRKQLKMQLTSAEMWLVLTVGGLASLVSLILLLRRFYHNYKKRKIVVS